MSENKLKICKIKKKRNRISLVCSNCRGKKIKCDKQRPCSSCVKSQSTVSCIYNYSNASNDERSTVDLNEKEISKYENLSNTEVEALNLKKFNNNDSNNNDNNSSILYYKFELTSNYLVLRKPSRTQARPYFFFIYLKQKNRFLHNILLSFKHFLNIERKTWKSKNFNKHFQLLPLQGNIYNIYNTETEMSKLNSMIESLICNNYYAILERLNFFQNQLNHILFNSYIPMGVVHLVFQHYFIVKPSGFFFNYPKKKFEYSFIALITSLVELSNIFTKNEETPFTFQLPYKNNEFNEFTIMLLNFSNYRRKPSIFNLYTLLNLRLSLMVYGDTQSDGVAGQNSYPIFESVVGLCKELGVCYDQNKIMYFEKSSSFLPDGHYDKLLFSKEVPSDSIKLLWNYVLTLDTYYYINLSCPPIIDERYCHGYYSTVNANGTIFEEFIKTTKQLSIIFLGLQPVNLTEIIEGIQKVNVLISGLVSFKDLSIFEKDENTWELVKLKFELLKFLLSLYLHLLAIISESSLSSIFPAEFLDDPNFMETLINLRKECTIKSKITYFIGLTTILNMSQLKLSNKFLLYNREAFSTWLGVESMIFMDIIISEDVEAKKFKQQITEKLIDQQKSFKLPIALEFNIKELETALFTHHILEQSTILKMVNDASSPDSLASFLTNVYENTIEIPILLTDYKFFVMTKLFLICIYFLYSYIKANCEANFVISENLTYLNELTKKIVSKNIPRGKISHIITPEELTNEIDHGNLKQKGVSVIIPNDKDTDEDLSNPSTFDDISFSFMDDNCLTNIFDEIDQYFNMSLDT